MSNSDPHPLWQVLEEEYKALHCELPSEYVKERDKIIDKKEIPPEQKKEEILSEIYKTIHKADEKRAALCLSGGGIRSATFALGILQGLAECGLLEKFHYLSTVSGGGYIGSWLTNWLHYEKPTSVIDDLKGEHSSPLHPESHPLVHLRDYSNYLSPRLGFLSADTWTLVSIYFRNLLLNWLMFIPLLTAVLLIPRICIAVVQISPNDFIKDAFFWLGAGMGMVSIAYNGFNRPSGTDPKMAQKWKRLRGQVAFLYCSLLPLSISAIMLTTYWAWFLNGMNHPDYQPGGLLFVQFGAILTLSGWALSVVLLSIFDKKHTWKRKWVLCIEGIISFVIGVLGGLLAWVAASNILSIVAPKNQPIPDLEWYVCLAAPFFLLAYLLVSTLFVGWLSRFTSDEIGSGLPAPVRGF